MVGGSGPGELDLQAAFLAAIADLRDGDVSPPRTSMPPPMEALGVEAVRLWREVLAQLDDDDRRVGP